MIDFVHASRDGYSEVAPLYERTRPGYPPALLARLARRTLVVAGDPVAELGAGTGRFTSLLAEADYDVTAIEPNARMRAQARPHARVRWTAGTFERTRLRDRSQRWVVSAQAFHWADATRALPEIARVLRPDGWLTVLWNTCAVGRDPTLRWTYRALARHVPEYGGVGRASALRRLGSYAFAALAAPAQSRVIRLVSAFGDPRLLGKGMQLQLTGHFGSARYDEVRHRVSINRQGYLDLWRTRTRLRQVAGPWRFEAFLVDVERHLEAGRVDCVTLPYICAAWSTRLLAS